MQILILGKKLDIENSILGKYQAFRTLNTGKNWTFRPEYWGEIGLSDLNTVENWTFRPEYWEN